MRTATNFGLSTLLFQKAADVAEQAIKDKRRLQEIHRIASIDLHIAHDFRLKPVGSALQATRLRSYKLAMQPFLKKLPTSKSMELSPTLILKFHARVLLNKRRLMHYLKTRFFFI